jgi:lipopolysaccharide export LptBFGC system permease protein LptF
MLLPAALFLHCFVAVVSDFLRVHAQSERDHFFNADMACPHLQPSAVTVEYRRW